MKILVGMPAPDSWGGPIASEPPFVEALRLLGHEVTEEVYVYGDKDTPTPFFSRVSRVVRTAWRFRKLVKVTAPDVIHLNSAFDRKTILRDSFTLFIMGDQRSKIFVKVHGSRADELKPPSFVERKLIGYLKRRVAGWGYHTREELDAFQALGFDGGNFFPVRNAVTVQLGLPDDFVRAQKDPDEIFELLFVSRFVPTKGLLKTIEACSELRSRGIKFRLTCVGDGETRREAEDMVGREGLGRVIRFTGHIPEEEVTKHFLSCDIFVFPTSHPEGFPNALFKAVALGMAVVTTRIRAAADYLTDRNCSYSTTEPKDIADRLQELIEDKSRREAMSRTNIEYGRTLSPEQVAREFEAIYIDLAGRDRGNE